MAFDRVEQAPEFRNGMQISRDVNGDLRAHFMTPDAGPEHAGGRRRQSVLLSSSGVPTVAGVSLLSLLLAACNGGGGSSGGGGGGGSGSSGTSGSVADGYLTNMKVYRLGNPSAFVTTDANGRFTGLAGTGSIVAEPTAQSKDVSTGLLFLSTLTAPDGATIVNPITTILQAALSKGLSAANVKAALGIDASVNLLTYDPVAANDVKTQLVAAQIANVLSAAAKNGITGDLAGAIATQIKSGVAVDLTSKAFLQTIGVANANLAQALAGANTATPDTIAGIAEVQKLIQNLAAPATAQALDDFLTNIVATAKTYDKTSPDAPTQVSLAAQGGTIVADTLNSTNINLIASAKIVAGQATGGKAELLLNGVVIATDASIGATDTQVDFSLGKTSAQALQAAVASGGAVAVKLYDMAGNAVSSATKTLNVDYAAPQLATVTLAGLDNGATAAEAIATGAVQVTGELGAAIQTTFTGQSGVVVKSLTGNGSLQNVALSAQDLVTLGNGQVSVSSVQTDAAGNPQSGSASSVSFRLDTQAPTATAIALTGLDNGATAAEATATGALQATGEAGASISVILTGQSGAVSKSVTATGAAQNIALSADDLATLGDGTVTISASQVDAAGNAQSGTTTTRTFRLDTHAPEAPAIKLTGLANGATASEAAKSGAIAVTGETGASIHVTFTGQSGSVSTDLTGTGSAQTVSLTSQDLAKLGDGAVSISATQADAAGNAQAVTAATASFTLDTVAPTITIASAAGDGIVDASEIQNGFDITGTANGAEDGQLVTVTLAGQALDPVAVVGGAWTVHVGAGVAGTLPASATLSAAVTDAAGNAASASYVDGLAVAVASDGVDGYISNAQFFLDKNGNLTLDAGEIATTGDGLGAFVLPGNAPIVMKGGVDISTGLAFTSIYETPTAYRVVNPVTTLVRELARFTDTGAAEAEVKSLLGSAGAAMSLATFNPFKAAISGAASDYTAAVAYQKLSAELSLVMDVGSSVLTSLAGETHPAAALAMTQSFSVALVRQMASAMNGESNLSESYVGKLADWTYVKTLISGAAQGAPAANAHYAEVLDATAKQIALANGQIAGLTPGGATSAATIDALTQIAKVQVVAKGEMTDAIEAYVTGGSSSLPDYTHSLALKAAAAAVGVIVPTQVSGALAAGTTATEAEGSASSGAVFEVVLTRSGDTSASAEVAYDVQLGSNITAASFAGAALPSGVATFAAGQSTATISLATIGDDIAQRAKSFVLKVSDPSGAVKFVDASGNSAQTLNFGFTLANDDAPALSAPAVVAVQPGVATLVTGLSISYPDAAAAVSVTIAAGAGSSLDAAASSGASVNGVGASTLVISGTVAQVNDALASLSANIPASVVGGLTITPSAAGVGSQTPVLLPFEKHYAPVITAPPTNAEMVAGDITVIHGFSVADPDASSITLQLSASGGRIYGFTNAYGEAKPVISRSVATNGVVTISGAVSEVNKALDGLTVGSFGESFSLTIKAIDGDAVTTDPVTVWTTTAAPAPTFLTLPSNVAVKAGQTSAVQGVQVSDADSNLVTMSLTPAGGSLAFGATSATIKTVNGVTTLSGSQAAVNDALATMTFKALANATSASIAIVADDGDPRSAAASGTLTLTLPVNGAPSAGGNLAASAVTEDTATQLSITGFTLVDADGPTPTSVRILSVTGGALTNPDGTAITLGASGAIVPLTGGALKVAFTPAPDRDVAASFSYVVVDAGTPSMNSQASTVTIPIIAVNDAPVVDLGANSAAYVEQMGKLPLAVGVTLSDVDSAQLSGAVVTIASGFSAGDVLAAGALPFGVTSTYASGVLTLSGAASLSAYQAALRLVTFENASDDPSTAARTITFRVTDAQGATSDAGSLGLTLAAVNDAPTLAVPAAALQATEQVALSLAGKGISIGDVDIGSGQATIVLSVVSGALSATADGVAAAASNDGRTLTLTGTMSALGNLFSGVSGQIAYVNPSDNPALADRLTISVTDNGGLSVVKSVAIGVTPVNDPVSIDLNGAATGRDSASLYAAGAAAGIEIAPAASVADPDSGVIRILAQISSATLKSGDVLQLSASAAAAAAAANASVTYESSTGALSIVAAANAQMSLAAARAILQGVSYLSTDSAASGARSVTISVLDVADGTPATAIANVSIAGKPYASISGVGGATVLGLSGDPGVSSAVVDLAQHRVTGDGASLAVQTNNLSFFAVTDVDAGASGKAVRIIGDLGANVLKGSVFDDVISGGLGQDILTGGGGNDVFVFGSGDTGASAAAADKITDFSIGDTIRLPTGMTFLADPAQRSGAALESWVEVSNGRTYVVFEANAAGDAGALRYIDIGDAAQARRIFAYDAASGALKTQPGLALSSDKASLKAGETAVISFTFSDAPSGFDSSDLAVSGGRLGAIAATADPKIFTAAFTPDAVNGGAASIRFTGAFTDASGAAGASRNALAISVDTIAPTLTIASDKSSLKAGETANITLTFSEAPSGFVAADDLTVTGGSLGAVQATADPKVFKAVFTPAASNQLGAAITLSGAYADAAGNAGSANTLAIAGDTLAPSLSISAAKTSLNTGEATTLTFNFSEAPVGFAANDLTVTGGVLGAIQATADARVYTASFTPAAGGGSASVAFSGAYADVAGNAGAGGQVSLTSNVAPAIALASSVRTINEDANNTGRSVAFNATGPGVYAGSEGTGTSLTITDSDSANFAGGSLNVHIVNRAAITGIGGDRLGISSSREQFRIDANGDVWFRQDTRVSGSDGFTLNGRTYASGDAVVVDSNSADDVRIGTLATIDGVLQDGKRGADLRVNLNENATAAIVQQFATNVVFGVRLYDGSLTEAWENFLPAQGVQQSVQFTLDDGKGGVATAARPVSVVAVNDAPAPAGDGVHVASNASAAATGNVLANDTDPDNLGGTVAPVQTLSVAGVSGAGGSGLLANGAYAVQGAHGLLSLRADGSYSYTANAADAAVKGLANGQQLTDVFTYRVSDDGKGSATGPLSATATLTVTIDGANQAPIITLASSPLTLDENTANDGWLVAFNGSGLGVKTGSDGAFTNIAITDVDNANFGGGQFRVDIINPVETTTGGNMAFLRVDNGLFRIDAQTGKIYLQQDARVAGRDGYTSGNVTYAAADNVVRDTNPADDIEIGSFAISNGVVQSGWFGAPIVINLTANATPERVQLLASEIGLGVYLKGATPGDYATTQGWENFLPAQGVQQGIRFTLSDGAGGATSATRDVNVVARNDGPVALNDTAHISETASVAATGNVLSNDSDPDNVAGMTAAQTLRSPASRAGRRRARRQPAASSSMARTAR